MRKIRCQAKPKRRRWPRVLDITREIAISKAAMRVRGPFLQTCSACGQRFPADKKEEHLAHCHPPAVHIPQTGTTAARPPKIRTRPNSYRPTPKPKPLALAENKLLALVRAKGIQTCPFCGKQKKGLRSHLFAKHRGQGLRNLSSVH
jgi:hypothetical protein